MEYLRLAVRLDPSRERAWDLLTALLAEEEEMDEAAAVARKRLETKDNAHNRLLLAKVYADQGQFAKAAEQLRAGLKSDPNDLDCRLGLIAALLKREDAPSLRQAGEELDAVEVRTQEDKSKARRIDYLLLRGLHAALDDRPAPAKEYFKQVLRLNKGNATVWKARAALGDSVGPADEQDAADFLRKLGGKIEREGKRPDAPVVWINLSRVADEDLFCLSAFRHLRKLRVSGEKVTDAGLIYLKDLLALRELDLSSTEVTNKGLVHLKTLANLRDLSLDSTKVTDAGLLHLKGFQNLETLSLDESPHIKGDHRITGEGFVHLRKLPKLRDVSVGTSVTDEGLAHLAAIPQLRKLNIMFSKITDRGISQLEHCKELRELWLSGTEITDAGLAHLKGLKKLRELHLDNTKITDAGLVHLKELTSLEKLELGDTAITDDGLAQLRGLTNLRELDLKDFHNRMQAIFDSQLKEIWSKTPRPGFPAPEKKPVEVPTPEKKSAKPPITDAGLKHLQGLTNLEKLDLDGRAITDKGLAQLKGLTKLRWLFIDSSRITDNGLSHLEALPQLERLSLGETSITDKALIHLRGLKRLEFIGLRETKVTREGVAELRKALPKLDISR